MHIFTQVPRAVVPRVCSVGMFWLLVNLPAGASESLINTWLQAGYREDSLEWDIAYPGNTPDVASELKWDDMRIYQLSMQIDMLLKEHWYIRANGGYGWIDNDDVEDSDYALNSRNALWSRSNSDAGDGNVVDLSIALGYAFNFYPEVFSGRVLRLVPVAGYSEHRQDLTLSDGKQTYSNQANADLLNAGITVTPLGPIEGLDSTYETQWSGPWLGLEFWLNATQHSILFIQGEYHKVDYTGEGDWNLRSDLAHPKSYEHEADADAYVFRIGYNQEVLKGWNVGLTLETQKWSTDSGDNTVYLADGGTITSRFNGAEWQSSAVWLNMRFTFDSGKGSSLAPPALFDPK